MEVNVALLSYAVLQFIAFVLVLVATPLEMFRINNQSVVTGYFSLWGTQQTIGNLSFFSQSSDVWALCPGRLMRFRLAQALAVLSILLFCAAFALGVVMLFCCPLLRWICLLLNTVGAASVCVVWVDMVLTFFNIEGRSCPALQEYTKYGVGFALLVAAWMLDIINIVFLVFPFNIMVFRKTDSANVNLDEISKGESKGESQETRSQKQEEDE